MTKILIATTNEGKFREIKSFLGDLPIEFVSLEDLKNKYKEPIEDQPTFLAWYFFCLMFVKLPAAAANLMMRK